jgi:hypothetical protein
MKKLLVSIFGLFMLCSMVQAMDFGYGVQGEFAGLKKWKSSDTASNDGWVVIATGNIVVGYIQVSSPGINSWITLQQSSATGIPMNLKPNWFGSSVPTSANNTGAGFGTTKDIMNPLIYVMTESTAGWGYKTSGDLPATIRILWDYRYAPKKAP